MSDKTHQQIHLTDGNQTLDVIERVKRHLSDNPKDFPTLTAAHLGFGGKEVPTGERVDYYIDQIMSRDLRSRAVGAAMFKVLTVAHVLLYDVYLLGRFGFVQLLKETMRADSLAAGLNDKELERSWEIYEHNMQLLAARGAHLRKRKDWRG